MKNKQSNKVALASFEPRKILTVLLGISALLVLIHVGLQYLVFHGGAGKLTFLTDIFNLDDESSIPTWFSSGLLLISAIVSGVIAMAKQRRREPHFRHWRFVSFIFLFLSIDEIATIHEHLINIVQTNDAALDGGGISAWYIYAALMVAAAAIPLLRFWWRLPSKIRLMLGVSAAVYLFGAVVFDNYDGGFVGRGFLHDGILVGIEEGLELLGACLFAYTLCSYAYAERILLAVQFKQAPVVEPIVASEPVAVHRPAQHRPRLVTG